ncbi:hypothetical protein FHL15_006350 [Xylaria flabelliformis]|uniref:Uncharacterized protein n=1 Tax=Xylaria flabelliformis TaxID=2512241 RepID=A0A553HXJ6_9PEZI|nr:hypothetical protein FHL15_006350 [Xylaria flabelliformis]
MVFSFQTLVQQHNSEMESAFRSLVDTIVRGSKLSISLLRISSVTEDSFHVTLEARLTRTGPVSATIAPMTLDLCGPAGQFGKVTLPAITTQAYGTEIDVTSQPVKIIDTEALKAFIRNIIKNDSVVLSLRNGETFITALSLGPREVLYEKELELSGMKGPIVKVNAASIVQAPQVAGTSSIPNVMPSNVTPFNTSLTTASISSTAGSSSGNTISVVFHVANPSPLEMSFGTCFFDIQNHEGKLLAELKGRLDIRRKHFQATFQGNVNRAVAAKLAADMREAANNGSKDGKRVDERGNDRSPRMRLVGKRCAGAGWCDETIKGIDVPVQNADKLFRVLGMDASLEEPNNKRSSITKWTQKLMLR